MPEQENSCLTCIYAEWKQIVIGGLHTSGDGRCLWNFPTETIPKAFYYPYHNNQTPPLLAGALEYRNPYTDCPCWELDSRLDKPKVVKTLEEAREALYMEALAKIAFLERTVQQATWKVEADEIKYWRDRAEKAEKIQEKAVTRLVELQQELEKLARAFT